ncbi:EamA family transporter [Gordonia sp. (in: high G+C Gram-positive bacteria)]|uniref:EamA family transporter n=1 Tax=Gordonia sp. (in: high G+C Gram-positive bacteria) TaxID=84139 RepID=UPI003F961577
MIEVNGGGRPGTAVAMIVGSCTSLQFGAALAVGLIDELGSWGVTFLRLAIAAVVLMIVVRPRIGRWGRGEWTAVVAFGLVTAAMNGCFYAAIGRIPLGTTVAIEFLGPLVLAAVLSRRRADLLWVGLAFVGMALLGVDSILGASSLDPVGIVCALLAGLFWAGYILAGARVSKAVPGTGGLAAALTVSAVAMLPLGAHQAMPALHDWRILALGVATALLGSVIPYSLELSALRRVPERVFGVLLSLEPVVAVLVGLLVLHQRIGLLPALAVGAVIAASAGTTSGTSRSEGREARVDVPGQTRVLAPSQPS